MVNFAPITAAKIAESVSGTIIKDSGGAGFAVTALGEPLEVGAGAVAFIISEGYVKDAAQTKAEVLVIQAALAEKIVPTLPATVKVVVGCADAYVGLAKFSKVVADNDSHGDWRLTGEAGMKAGTGVPAIHPTAKVDPTAKIGPGVVIGEGAQIGARTTLLANVVVGPECKIGADGMLFPGVVLYPRTQVGHRARLHANVVLGADGFGYARGPQGSVKIWHLGRVIVGDDVEIGAGTTVDRGTMKDTIIEHGVKIDNLCQIGHNGHIKAHAILCAQVGMAGNVTVGVGAILAGKVGVADKLEIGDGALVGPMSGLSKDVKAGEQVMGQQPAKPRREWWRLIVLFERLPELYDRVKKLEGKKS